MWWNLILFHQLRGKCLEFLSDRFSVILVKETARLATKYETKSGRRESLRKGFEVAVWTIRKCDS